MRHPQPVVIHRTFAYGSKDDLVCSFCQRRRSDGNRELIAGPDGVYICDECVDACGEILEEQRRT
jgi:ATP-dependent Clp protease ATP-binding subunit ClpX